MLENKINSVLSCYISPLQKLLSRERLVEISVVGEGQIGFEYADSGYVFETHPELDKSYWRRLCKVLANLNGLKFSFPKDPFLSVALPGGHRFQAKMGQGVESGLDISIRLFRNIDLSFDSFGLSQDLSDDICHRLKKGMNCLISGGTSSGKTTFLRHMLNQIPTSKRILTLEDTREIFLPNHKHILHHMVARNGSSDERNKAYGDEIDHMMRSRPDIIVLGEVSTSNAFPILRFLNSGHAGFFSTVHANTADLAMSSAIPQNIALSGHSSEGVEGVLRATLDMVIQLNKVDGKRLVTEIYFPQENRRIIPNEDNYSLRAA